MVSICKSGKENSVICLAGAVATAGELWHTVTFDMATKDVHLQGSQSVWRYTQQKVVVICSGAILGCIRQ